MLSCRLVFEQTSFLFSILQWRSFNSTDVDQGPFYLLLSQNYILQLEDEMDFVTALVETRIPQ